MAKERPYRCQLCSAPLAEDELGFVCEHVAHGTWNTLLVERPKKGHPIPDAPCTACAFAIDAKKKNAETKANIHLVCRSCYGKARARNVDYATQADVERGYVLVPRSHYDRIVKRDINLDVGPITVGRALKLGFSPIPATHPVSLERMWVRVTCIAKGGVLHGSLANYPELFKRKILKADDTVVFRAAHVLETEAPKAKRGSSRKPLAKAKARPTKK